MKKYVYPAALCLSLAIAAFCGAADLIPVAPDCPMLQSAAVTKLEQRIEIAPHGFSILPPQGERWCYRLLTSAGVSFFKIPPTAAPLGRPPPLEEIMAMRLFSGMAMSLDGLRDFETQIQSSDELQAQVDHLIRDQLFAQIIVGVSVGDHRFRLLESSTRPVSYSGATCVRFDARVEERGNVQTPTLIFVLNFPANVVCRHPTVAETRLIWIGFVERYLRSEQPMADTLKREYEPYVQSVQFMPPRQPAEGSK